MFAQDWGGPIGLSAIRRDQSRFNRVVLYNTVVPKGEVFTSLANFIGHIPYLSWRIMTKILGRNVPPRLVVKAVSSVSRLESFGYSVPFPNSLYTAGIFKWPLLIPMHTFDSFAQEMRQVEAFFRFNWDKPSLFGYSDKELFTVYSRSTFQFMFPSGCEKDVPNAGHFLQEDQSPLLSRRIIQFINGGCNAVT